MILILFVLGLLYSNFLEWILHKYVLHGLGKKKNSRWGFHLHHHRKCIFSKNYDDDYEDIGIRNLNELRSLISISILHLPILFLFPFFYLGAALGGLIYFIMHRKCHLDVAWGKKWMPWHYVHHMKKSNSNWCVTYPIFDKILGTYEPYIKENTGESPPKQKNEK